MPILDIGYRKWEGPRSPAWTRAWVVATTGVKLVWTSTWIKRVLLLLIFPSIFVGILVGAFEQSISESSTQRALMFLNRYWLDSQFIENSGMDATKLKEDPTVTRHFAWTYLLFSLFRYPQAFGMVLVLGLVGPRLISYDLRSRAYLLYLSRPLTPGEYVLGKAGVLYTLMFWIATVPAMTIFLVGLFLSTDQWAISYMWDIPLRILAASIVLILPTSALALALSSLTQESRYAGFAWFAIWLIGHVTFTVLRSAQQIQSGVNRREWVNEPYNPLMYLSPYELLGYMQKKAFGLLDSSTPIVLPLLALVLVTVVGYGVAYWRVSRTLKL